jgi:hypothetical protein
MKSLLTIAFIIVFAVSLYQLAAGYMAAEGTPWQKLVATFRESATLAVAFVVRVLTAIGGSVDGLTQWLNMPEAQAVIQRYLTPDTALFLMLGVAIAVELARRRRASMQPVAPPPLPPLPPIPPI